MRHLALLLACAAACVTPALAEEDPQPGTHDSRIRFVVYDPGNVVRVLATDLRSTMIQLSSDERVEPQSIALGDETAWQVAPLGNLIFIRPKASPGRETNMQVVSTRKDGAHRIYQFELVPQPTTATDPVYAVNFRYPRDVVLARRKAAEERAERMAADLARQRLAVDLFYGPRNWRYCARGAAAIQPSEVSSNGVVTTFRFPANVKAPAIYEVVEDGTPGGHEQLVEAQAREDFLVVHGISNVWRLRLGNYVADVARSQSLTTCAIARGFIPVGIDYRTGTTSPEIIRSIRSHRQ